MHRKDGVKSAEIEALKKLLTDKMVVSAPNEIHADDEMEEHRNRRHLAHRAQTAPQPANEREAPAYMPQHKRYNQSLSNGPVGMASPKKKLSEALETGRGGAKQGALPEEQDFLAAADKDVLSNMMASEKTPQEQLLADRKTNREKSRYVSATGRASDEEKKIGGAGSRLGCIPAHAL